MKRATTQNVTDEGTIGKYYHYMLNMADDDLNPYEYRLLGHYRRICGMTGKCDEGTREIARKTHMSVGSVSAARKSLQAKGYIACTYRGDDLPIVVRVLDLMQENVTRYAKPTVQDTNTPVHTVNTPSLDPVHTVNDHKQLKQQEISSAIAEGATLEAKESAGASPVKRQTKKKNPPTPLSDAEIAARAADKAARSALFDAVALHIFGIEKAANGEGGRVGALVSWLMGGVEKVGRGKEQVGAISAPATPEHVAKFAQWWKRTYKDASPPRDPVKFVEAWRACATALRKTTAAAPNIPDTVAPMDEPTDYYTSDGER